jgi:tetratricopeptide (TPR) repeat protein
LGWQAFRRRQLEKARDCWQEALEIGDKIGNQHLQCLSRAYWAEYCLQVGQVDEAERCGREALALASSLDHPWYMASALFALAQTAQVQGHMDEAQSLAQESLSIFAAAKHARTTEVQQWLTEHHRLVLQADKGG